MQILRNINRRPNYPVDNLSNFTFILAAKFENLMSSTIAKNLKTLRELHDYTQDYVADYLGVSQNTYSLMERGETRITIDRLETLATLYNMDLADILKFNETLIIHNMNNNSGVGICNKEMIVNNNISIDERKLFQETLARLEKENERLLKIIEKLSGINE